MKSGLKLLLITLPIVLIGLGFLAYTVANKPAPERFQLAERAAAVRVIVAREQSVSPKIIGHGIVRPVRTYDAFAQVGGIAEYVNPDLQRGSILPAGAVLVRLSQADFNLAIAQARANIRAAEAKLAELTVSEANLTAALEIEEEALALATRDLERVEKLFSSGTASQSARDGARKAHLAQRQKTLNIQSSLAVLPTQRAVQNEQIAVYKANLETATLNLERTELTLPFAARVASVSVEVGQFVRAGSTAAQLDGIEAAEVEAQVSVAELRTLLKSTQPELQDLAIDSSAMTKVLQGLGLSVNVQLRLGQGSIDWPANVDRMSDTIDQKTGTLGMIVRVDNAYQSAEPGNRPPLTKGMFVEVTLSAPPVKGIMLPRNAVRNGQVMLADADSRLQLLSVNPLLVQGDIALVTKGLEPGMRVVVSSPNPVMSGLLLDVTEDEDLLTQLSGAGQAE